MPQIIIAGILALLMLLAIVLNKTYHHLPLKELKRQARHGQQPAGTLYRAAAYGSSLQSLLFVVVVLSAAGSFVLLGTAVNPWLAFLLVAFLIWMGFLWLPSSRLTSFSSRLATWASPLLAWILHYAHPLLEKVSKVIHDRYGIDVHTGLYDKTDLLELLQWQKEQSDSRINPAEIELAQRALMFGDKLVRDVMVARQKVKQVGTSERISPVLIDELHQSGFSRFPVYEGKKDHIVGTLYLKDLLAEAKSSKSISSIMKRDIRYIHEDFTLHQVLQAFFKTKRHLFVVINKFEEFVGIVTVEDALSQIVGGQVSDEFDQYEDIKAVAAAKISQMPDEHVAEDGQEDSTPEIVEVIE